MLSADGDQPLEPRQEEYCRRRALGESPGKAYIAAGYKAVSGKAYKLGWRLEQRPSIKARITALKAIVGDAKLPAVLGSTNIYGAISRRRGPVDKEYVLDGLVEIAERCMQHHVLTDAQGKPIKVEGPNGQMCLLVGFRPKEATRAYELLGKELGMFVERLDATHRFEERYRTMTQAERMADAEALADEVRRLLGRQEKERLEAEATDAEAVEIVDEEGVGQSQTDDILPEIGEIPGKPAPFEEPMQPNGSSPPGRGRGWRSRQLASKRARQRAPDQPPPQNEEEPIDKPQGLGKLGLGVPK